MLLIVSVLVVGCGSSGVGSRPSALGLTTDRDRYRVEEVANPYDQMETFRDGRYYYYLIPVANIYNVPLEGNLEPVEFNGIDYDVTFTSGKQTVDSISSMITEAEETCITGTSSLTIGVEVGNEASMVKGSVEAGYSHARAKSTSKETSVQNTKEYTENYSISTTVSFDSSDKHGYYRWILMGTLELNAVVIFDTKASPENAYSCQTYSVITGKSYKLDYSQSEFFDGMPEQIDFQYDKSRIEGVVPTYWVVDQTQNGDGSEEAPYTIFNSSDFASIASKEGYFILMQDIDFQGQTISKIDTFSGNLNGNGYSIYNFRIDYDDTDKVGLVGENNGTIKNLVIGSEQYETKIEAEKKNGTLCVGGIAGVNNGTIENCKLVNVDVNSTTKRSKNNRIYNYTGGVVGDNKGRIANCTVDNVSVFGEAKHSSDDFQSVYAYAGGIAGGSTGIITYCLANSCTVRSDATVKANMLDAADAVSYAGGLVGIAKEGAALSYSIVNAGDVSADATGSGGWGDNKPTLYIEEGVLFGVREVRVICSELYGVNGRIALVGDGDKSACASQDSINSIGFYASNQCGYKAV